ncbi:MAG: glycosyltransferase family 4 protein [Lachnospiraceae bacterium]|nr:glycosyltransferase family 4 protein [Lachnospiraceae bacterium]
MRILSVLAQKPSSTGSGVYLSELVKCFKRMGHEQEIICAMYEGEQNCVDENRRGELCEPVYNPVIFNTAAVPLKIAGMSDVMPYESIKYSDLANDEKLLAVWAKVFEEKIEEVIGRFKPDLIICHHLYLLTAMVADYRARSARPYDDKDRPYNDKDCTHMGRQDVVPYKIFGICHNTDLRQYQQTDLKREFIKENIKKLDKIFSPSEEHKQKIVELFDVDENKIEVIGIGYNSDIFYKDENLVKSDNKETKLLYVGKVAKKKGVMSLVKAFKKIDEKNISLDIIGGAGDKNEYDEILKESVTSQNKINFLPPMKQTELAKEYNSHDIFILPSFSEGVPMVPIEALACGCKVVISDLPGVKTFYDANIKNACIKYVKLPEMTNVDDADIEELCGFEKRLKDAIIEAIDDKKPYKPELASISWENITKTMLK